MHLIDLIVYVNGHQALQTWISIACMVTIAVLTLAPFICRQVSPHLPFLKQPWIFLVLIGISLFFCRYPGFFYPHNLNEDEAQMLAQAITYETHPIPWRDVDGGSGGPIDSYVLLWCLPFGIQPTYLTGRVLELSCVFGMLIFLYLAGRRVAGDLAARLALMPVFLFICWSADGHFVHYSSEEVSLFLLSWALYIIVKLARVPATTYTVIELGLLLGLLPFAKLQSVMLGGFLGLTAIWFLYHTRHYKREIAVSRILLLLISAFIPTLIILSTVAHARAIDDFWQSYIVMSQGYGNRYSSLSENLGAKMDTLTWILEPGADTGILIILTVVSTLVVGSQVILGFQKITRVTRNWFVWAILFALTSIATILFTSMAFTHYKFFLLPTFTFLMAINFRLLRLSRPGPFSSNGMVPLVLATIISTPLITADLLFHTWNNSTRYLLMLLPMWLGGLSLVLIVTWSMAQPFLVKLKSPLAPSSWQKFTPVACLIPFFVIPVLILAYQPNQFQGNIQAYLNEALSPMDQAILRDRPAGGRLAIWGWAPEFAAETQTPLGTRDAVAPCDAHSNPLANYYRRRYLHDLQTNRPELFLEATGPDNFYWADPKAFGIETFPELAKYISDQYRLDQEIDGMRLFIRRDIKN